MTDGTHRNFINSEAQSAQDDEIDLLELLRTLWRGKIWIALVTVVALGFGVYYAYFAATPMYTAQATVALENRQEQMIGIEAAMSGLSGDQATINTEIEVLRSRRLAQQLVRDMNLVEDPEFNTTLQPEPRLSIGTILSLFRAENTPPPSEERIFDVTTNNVMSAMSVSNIRSSYVFTIQAITTDPNKSAAMANTLADLYIEDQVTLKNEATENAVEWLSQRVANLRGDLQTAEREAQAFAARTTLVSPEALEALNLQIKNTRIRLEETRQSASDLSVRVASLEAANDTGQLDLMLDTADDAALNRLAENDASEETLRARFASILNDARTAARRAQNQVSSLETALAQLEENYNTQADDLVALEQLQREAAAARNLYEFFLGRMKELTVQTGTQKPDSRVLSDAILPNDASAPRKSLILALAAILGLIVGSALILIREMMEDGFRTAEDLEAATGTVILGQIPAVPAKYRKNVIEYFIQNPTSPAAEAIRNMRTSLMLSNPDRPPQVIMTTSAVPGEGKTTNSMSLALNYAGMGKKVLLLEGDIRRRVFSEYFDIHGRSGMLSILSGDKTFDEVVYHEETLGVDIILGDKGNTNAADVFMSERFADFLKECRDRYDIVIVDTAPVLLVPDSRIIAHHVDAVVMTVRWDHTSKAQVTSALRQFEVVGKPVSGLALSQIDPKGMKRYGYGGRYGAYQAYGESYDRA